MRVVPPFDHWYHHFSHRDCSETIGLTPEQNDWAIGQIYNRLAGHELAWADQLIQGFV